MGNKSLHLFFDEIIINLADGKDNSRIFMPEFFPKHQMQTNWYAITGSPCAGKTTVLKALENLGFPVIHERGRFVIESALAEGFSTDEIFASQQLLQETILKAKIIAHLENPLQKLTILEDGIPESLAYFRIENLETAHVSHIFDIFGYRKILFFDALPLMNDPARPHSQEKINQLSRMKKQVHQEMGYEIIQIPVLPVNERVEMILKFLGNVTNGDV